MTVTAEPSRGPESRDDCRKDGDTTCDIFGWAPGWLQRFADIRLYVFIYGLMGLAELGLATYNIAIVSTVEKRFKLTSRMSGTILSGWDMGTVCGTLFISYMGSSARKSRWVAYGSVIVALSCFFQTIPHILYGPGEDALMLASVAVPLNTTEFENGTCQQGFNDECLDETSGGSLPAYMFLFSNIVLGMGACGYFTLGLAYLDDNSKKNKVPLLLAIVFCIRMIGPTIGFMLASLCLELYIDPAVEPTITNDDPRWIGAWWIGWIPMGILNLVLAFFIFPFPKTIAGLSENDSNSDKESSNKSFSDFRKIISRLVNNKVFLFNTISSTFYMLGIIGYWSFMPKYLETQFNQSASTASFLTGSVGLACTALGVVSSGAVISKFKPNPRTLAAWNVFVEFIDVIGHFTYAFLGCPSESIQGFWDSSGKWNMTMECNSDCQCGYDVKYNPLCSQDGSTTFYSPCHAGCTNSQIINGSLVYTNCSCSANGLVNDGACQVDCSVNFIIFLIILCSMRFFSATGRAGNTIIQFRVVKPEDKSVSIALTEFMFAICAFIPGPALYGHMMDITCLVWGYECGKTGNCWLYNGQTLRYYLNFTASGMIACAVVADIYVWRNVKGLKIYDDDSGTKKEREKNIQETTSLIDTKKNNELITNPGV